LDKKYCTDRTTPRVDKTTPTSSSISESSIQFFNVSALAFKYHTACAMTRERERESHASILKREE
jgi:hypothetical protein